MFETAIKKLRENPDLTVGVFLCSIFAVIRFEMSNLVLKSLICVNCEDENFPIEDNTKIYSATLNVGGWGVPNPIISDVTSSLLTVTSPGGVATDPIDLTLDPLTSLPATDGTQYIYDPTDNGQSFEDGIWVFDWVIKGEDASGDPYMERCRKKVLVDCTVACCKTKLVADADPSCGCTKSKGLKAIEAQLTYDSMWAAFNYGKEERANYLLGKLQNICTNSCKDC